VTLAPDYIEPVVGWRSWLVVHEGGEFRLRSVLYDALWLPRRELIARCLHRRLTLPWRKRIEHAPPARSCACGIYAARDPEEALSYIDGRSWGDVLSVHRVIGTVSLWGRVVECERGWRASYAYPRTIFVPPTRAPLWLRVEEADVIALSLTNYDVQVELLDEDACRPEALVEALSALTPSSPGPQ
jgi:hypothetical protein